MAIYKRGNMWLMNPEPDVWFVTANSVVGRGGRLIMGAGAALQAKEKFPNCDKWFGGRVRETCGSGGFYGILIHPDHPLGVFQTKYHWRQGSSYDLIHRSASALVATLASDKDLIVSLNFPGIGEGGLDKQRVMKLVTDRLPDRVYVWEWSEGYEDVGS